MSAALRLVIFDVDGTLVDSQSDIMAAMTHAFAAVGVAMPDRQTVLGMVGLSLDVIFPCLLPNVSHAEHNQMAEAYKSAYMDLRAQAGVAQSSPLYPGALDALKALHADPSVVLGVATGKSKRGLDKLLEAYALQGMFVTQQVADFHPSKPHPAMVLQALADTGVAAKDAVMVGDTSFDMDMAASAGVCGIGVAWGYHPVAQLDAAKMIIDSYDALPAALKRIWSIPA